MIKTDGKSGMRKVYLFPDGRDAIYPYYHFDTYIVFFDSARIGAFQPVVNVMECILLASDSQGRRELRDQI